MGDRKGQSENGAGLRLLALFGFVLTLASCSSMPLEPDNIDEMDEESVLLDDPLLVALQQEDESPSNTEQKADPRPKIAPLSPGDWVEISEAIDPKLNGKYQVEFDGSIHLPYQIQISTEGLNLSEFKSKLIRIYQKFYRNPLQFQISWGERRRWIEVGGLVVHPGRILVRPQANLDEIIAQAGGLTPTSPARFAKIEDEIHSSVVSLGDYFDRGEDTGIPDWQGGERITLLRESPEPPIHLLGEVRSPGDIPYQQGADFLYYLNQGLGPTQFADLQKIELIRGSSGQPFSKRFNLNERSDHPALEKGDTLLIHSIQPGLFERVVQAMTGVGALVASVAALVLIL